MQPDVDRLVQAAENLTGTWPSQPPPAIPEVAVVARHGKAVVPLLMVLLSDDPDAERDPKRWKVQQQVALALSRIYSESQHCGRTYCDRDPRERIARAREGWLRVIAADKEKQALSARDLLDRFKAEKVFWRQVDIGRALAAANDRGVIAELEAWLFMTTGTSAAMSPSFSDGSVIHADSTPSPRYSWIARRVPLARGSQRGPGRCRRRFVLIVTTPRTCWEI